MNGTAPGDSPSADADGNGSAALLRAFAPPQWLRDVGTASWFLVGLAIVLCGVFWALAAASKIVGPLVAGGVVATVAAPLVTRLQRRGLGRGAGAIVVLLALVAVAVAVTLLVVDGIAGQADEIAAAAARGADRIRSGLESVGLGSKSAGDVKSALESGVPAAAKGLSNGLVAGIQGLAALAIGISFTLFAVFFLLKDGPALRRTLERHLGVPEPIGRLVVRDLITSIRGYFLGVTIVAAFNGVVVGLGAWLLGVPLPATIGVVTYALAYVPFLGAFAAGTFAVVLALGSGGTSTAVWMLIVVLLANGLLQNIVSPFAMGAALDMNPLLNLAVTVGAGCLFGMFGLVLASPLTSASMHVAADLRRLRSPAAPPEPEVAAAAPGARAATSP